MKALITGPRSHGGDATRDLPYLHLETEFEELPKVGEAIVINDGNSVVVERVTWWVDGPDTPEAYSFNGGTYEGDGVAKGIHIDVLPDDWGRADRYAEGLKAGRRKAAEDLAGLLRLAAGVDGDSLRSLLGEWVKNETPATEA